MITLDRQNTAIAGLRLVDVADIAKRAAEIVESAWIGRIDRDRLAIFGQRTDAVAALVQKKPEIVVGFGDLQPAGDQGAVQPLGLGEPSGLMMLHGSDKPLFRL
ncbi:MAG TPA: hypothetical protein VG291_20060 [Xanthobacteraceae bacterium]|nr:hypothetical protein [Xanthobacteraceae bacterium]